MNYTALDAVLPQVVLHVGINVLQVRAIGFVFLKVTLLEPLVNVLVGHTFTERKSPWVFSLSRPAIFGNRFDCGSMLAYVQQNSSDTVSICPAKER